MDLERTHAQFQTTCWTIVDSLKSEADNERRRACLDALISRYWPPVYAFLRRQGLSSEQAAETSQAFFADVVLQRQLFERAAKGRGRLSSLILRALRNYRIDSMRAAQARGVDRQVPLDVDRLDGWLTTGDANAEQAFHRAWDAELLNEAMRNTEQHFAETAKVHHWRLFEAHVIHPVRTGGKSPGLEALAAELGFASAHSARAAVQVVKQRLQVTFDAARLASTGNTGDPEDLLEDVFP